MLYKALNVNIHNFHNIYPDLGRQNYKIGREIDDKYANSKISRQENGQILIIYLFDEMKDTLDTVHKMYKDETDVNGGIDDNQPLIIILQGQHALILASSRETGEENHVGFDNRQCDAKRNKCASSRGD